MPLQKTFPHDSGSLSVNAAISYFEYNNFCLKTSTAVPRSADYVMSIAGDGELSEPINDYIKANDLSEKVRMLGYHKY